MAPSPLSCKGHDILTEIDRLYTWVDWEMGYNSAPPWTKVSINVVSVGLVYSFSYQKLHQLKRSYKVLIDIHMHNCL